jgi:hypothetical protein
MRRGRSSSWRALRSRARGEQRESRDIARLANEETMAGRLTFGQIGRHVLSLIVILIVLSAVAISLGWGPVVVSAATR